jgi:hypothetical protein
MNSTSLRTILTCNRPLHRLAMAPLSRLAIHAELSRRRSFSILRIYPNLYLRCWILITANVAKSKRPYLSAHLYAQVAR